MQMSHQCSILIFLGVLISSNSCTAQRTSRAIYRGDLWQLWNAQLLELQAEQDVEEQALISFWYN